MYALDFLSIVNARNLSEFTLIILAPNQSTMFRYSISKIYTKTEAAIMKKNRQFRGKLKNKGPNIDPRRASIIFSKLQLVLLVRTPCFQLRCEKTKADMSDEKLHASSFAINRSSCPVVFYKKSSS